MKLTVCLFSFLFVSSVYAELLITNAPNQAKGLYQKTLADQEMKQNSKVEAEVNLSHSEIRNAANDMLARYNSSLVKIDIYRKAVKLNNVECAKVKSLLVGNLNQRNDYSRRLNLSYDRIVRTQLRPAVEAAIYQGYICKVPLDMTSTR